MKPDHHQTRLEGLRLEHRRTASAAEGRIPPDDWYPAQENAVKHGVEPVPVEMVPTTRRQHITGFAALNIPHAWRLGGDWHDAWFDVKPTRVAPYHITDERRFGRLLDRLGNRGLRDARPGLALLGHPAADWPEKVWAATHERAVIEMAWARLDGITPEDLPMGLPPVDRYSFERILPHPDQWVRVRWWVWRLRGVLTPTELAAWNDWQHEWWP